MFTCVYADLCVCVRIHVPEIGGQRKGSGDLPDHSLPYLTWREDALVNLELIFSARPADSLLGIP